jgi:hypothetical protein
MTPETSNLFLSYLSPASRQSLMDASKPVDLPHKTKLYNADTTPQYAYFLNSGLASVVTPMANGECAEVGFIGYEVSGRKSAFAREHADADALHGPISWKGSENCVGGLAASLLRFGRSSERHPPVCSMSCCHDCTNRGLQQVARDGTTACPLASHGMGSHSRD